jgi:hypothetical protein
MQDQLKRSEEKARVQRKSKDIIVGKSVWYCVSTQLWSNYGSATCLAGCKHVHLQPPVDVLHLAVVSHSYLLTVVENETIFPMSLY